MKRRGNGRFHTVSMWNTRGVFVGLKQGLDVSSFLIFLSLSLPLSLPDWREVIIAISPAVWAVAEVVLVYKPEVLIFDQN